MAGNVENFYTGLMSYLNFNNKVRKIFINHSDHYMNIMNGSLGDDLDYFYNSHIIAIQIRNMEYPNILSNHFFEKNNLKKKTTFKIKDRIFSLDSALLLDNNNEQFTAYITVNGEECIFEGYSKARIKRFNWKSKLNRKKSWKTFHLDSIEDNYNSFMKGSQVLYYYRI